MDITKLCSKCKIEKSSIEFNKQSKSKDQLSNWCKSCKKENNKSRYNSPDFDKQEYIESQKKWARRNPEKFKANLNKYRNKDKEN